MFYALTDAVNIWSDAITNSSVSTADEPSQLEAYVLHDSSLITKEDRELLTKSATA